MAQSRILRRALLSTAATSLALAMSGGALAQESDETEAQTDDVITVTGIRGSILNSIAEKRENTSIVEAISSEDIGKLPDVSIAESLARLPGVAAQRLRGRAQVLSVRGLGPDFTTALLNGREQVTAGDNRGVEFDQYPSELISQALVYKTPESSLVAHGLAGTVDLRTIRPLEFGRRAVSVNSRFEWNEIGALNSGSNDTGYRIGGTYVDQFANDTIGVVLSLTDQRTPTQSERFEAQSFRGDGNGNQIIQQAKPYAESRDLERTAFLGTLEFEPQENFNTSVDVLYTEFTDGGILRGIELALASWAANGGAVPQTAIAEGGLVIDGAYDNVFGIVRNDVRSRDAELFSFGWNAEYFHGDNLRFEVDLSHSSVDRTDIDLETYAGTGRAGSGPADRLAFVRQPGGNYRFNSSLDYSDPSLIVLTDPQGWGQAGFYKQISTEDELTALRADVERTFDNGPISSIEAGVYFSNREKSKSAIENFVDLAGGADEAAIPSQFLQSPTNLDFLGFGPMVSYDPFDLLGAGVYDLRPLGQDAIVQKFWTVEEEVITAYLQANLDGQVGPFPVVGNVGIQMVDTDQSSTGPIAFGGAIAGTVATLGDEYTDWLPSANLRFELTENTFLRLAAARTLSRARMDDLRASQGAGFNNQVCGLDDPATAAVGDPYFRGFSTDPGNVQVCIGAGGGNPTLRPYSSDSYDVSLEHYFADGAGYFSAAFFYKDLSDFVFGGGSIQVDTTQLLLDRGFTQSFIDANPNISVGTLSSPENLDAGQMSGWEFAMSLPGTVIDDTWEPFGLIASVSLIDSSVTDNNGNTFDIPGLSSEIVSATFYYERGGWEARISNRWRSDFVGEVTGFGADIETRNVLSESVMDAQIGYEFSEGPLEGLEILLSAQNLSDQRFGTYTGDDPRFIRNYEEYGTTYLIGVNWRR